MQFLATFDGLLTVFGDDDDVCVCVCVSCCVAPSDLLTKSYKFDHKVELKTKTASGVVRKQAAKHQ